MRLDLSKIKINNADIKRGIVLPEIITPELAEETGLHIGDGSMNFYCAIRANYKGFISFEVI